MIQSERFILQRPSPCNPEIVMSLAIFGSIARDEAGPDSDVDILVEFSVPVGAFKSLDVQEYLESLLGRRVDLVMRDAIKPRLRDRILKKAICAA